MESDYCFVNYNTYLNETCCYNFGLELVKTANSDYIKYENKQLIFAFDNNKIKNYRYFKPIFYNFLSDKKKNMHPSYRYDYLYALYFTFNKDYLYKNLYTDIYLKYKQLYSIFSHNNDLLKNSVESTVNNSMFRTMQCVIIIINYLKRTRQSHIQETIFHKLRKSDLYFQHVQRQPFLCAYIPAMHKARKQFIQKLISLHPYVKILIFGISRYKNMEHKLNKWVSGLKRIDNNKLLDDRTNLAYDVVYCHFYIQINVYKYHGANKIEF